VNALREVIPVLCNGIVVDRFWLGAALYEPLKKTDAYYRKLFYKKLRKFGFDVVTFAPSSVMKEVRTRNGERIWLNCWKDKKTPSSILSTWPGSLKSVAQNVTLSVKELFFCPKCNLVFPAKSCHSSHELIQFVPLKEFSYTLCLGLDLQISDESKSATWFLKALQEGKLRVKNVDYKKLAACIAISVLK